MFANRLRVFGFVSWLGFCACGAEAVEFGEGAGAGLSASTGTDQPHPRAERGGALTEAYAGLARGEQARITELIQAIDQQSAANPDDRYAVFYAGVFRVWRLAEGGLTLEALLGSLSNVQDMLTNLERAHALLPDDFRVTAFFGLAQALVGGTLGDDALLDKGMETFDLAVEQHAPYGRFLRAIAMSLLPREHRYFHYVLEDIAAGAIDCNFPKGPEGAAYQYPTDEEYRSRVCLNKSVVPHVWEGTFITYGDMATKAGWDAKRVRELYRSAMTSPDYQDWGFRKVLEQRIADTDMRVAAYADNDPFNDPIVWGGDGYICTGCHKDMASLVAR